MGVRTVVVAGATGNVGREVVRHLAEAGHVVRALTRDPARAAGKFPAGVEVVAGDLRDATTLAGVFEGATALHLINFGGDDYGLLDNGHDIVKLAVAAGVRKVTLLRGGERGTVEEALEAAGEAGSLEATFLHPVEFMSGGLDWAEQIKAEGVVREGFADRLSAMVHESDIGAVAAHVLTSDGHAGRSYTITGPEVLSVPDKLAAISAALGKKIELFELTADEQVAAWKAKGFPDEVIEFFVWAFGNTPEEGRTVSSTVEDLLGRPALPFRQWAEENVAAFR